MDYILGSGVSALWLGRWNQHVNGQCKKHQLNGASGDVPFLQMVLPRCNCAWWGLWCCLEYDASSSVTYTSLLVMKPYVLARIGQSTARPSLQASLIICITAQLCLRHPGRQWIPLYRGVDVLLLYKVVWQPLEKDTEEYLPIDIKMWDDAKLLNGGWFLFLWNPHPFCTSSFLGILPSSILNEP